MKLTHPDTDLTVDTDEDRADAYLSQGWVEKKSTSRSRSEQADES